MSVTTCFQRNMVRSGVYSPFNRRLSRKPHRNVVNNEKPIMKRPKRAIRIGDHINPFTSEILPGQAYLPLSTNRGVRIAFGVFGESGSGKSITLRDLVEYFAYEEGRCVIIFDDTKNQYWPFKFKQDRQKMLDKLKSLNIEPIEIPVTVYAPAYDEPVLGFKTMQQFKHVDKLLSIKTSALTTASFFELGNIDPSGRMYYNKLMEILNVPPQQRTVEYINTQLENGKSDPTMRKSISSLTNIFNPLCNMGIIRDDGTDVNEMLHPPQKGKPGKISVINLSTSAADDCRKSAVVATICQQIFDICRQNAERGIFFEPIVVLDEAKAYIGKQSSLATRNGFSLLHLQGRAWGIVPIYGLQNQGDVCDWLWQGNTNYLVEMKKSLPLLDYKIDENDKKTQPTVLSGSGLSHIFINGSGDEDIPDMDMYVKILPCRTRHVD